MGYWNVDIIVEGALSESKTVGDPEDIGAFMDMLTADLKRKGWNAEVYVIRHDHAPDLDCECVQFLTDHRPYWSSTDEPSGCWCGVRDGSVHAGGVRGHFA